MTAKSAALAGLKGLGYVAFFATFTLLFVLWTFPDESARDFAEVTLANKLGADVEIDELSVTGLGSVEIEGLTLRMDPLEPWVPPGLEGAAAPPAEGDGKSKPRYRRISADLDVDASVLPWIFGGDKDVEFTGKLMGGDLTGKVVYHPDTGAIDFDVPTLDGVELGKETLLLGLTRGEKLPGYDLRGKIHGSIKGSYNPKKLEDTRATLDLEIRDARIVDPLAPPTPAMPAPIPLTDIALGTLKLKVVVDKASEIEALARGRRSVRGGDQLIVHFAEVSAESDDIVFQVDDRSVIRMLPGRPMKDAVMDLHLSLQISDSYINKKVTEENGEVSQPNKGIKYVLQSGRVKASMVNGVLGVYCRGSISKIDCGLERPRRGSFVKRKPKFGTDDAGDDAKQPDDRDETRRTPPRPKKPTTARNEEPARPATFGARRGTARARPAPKRPARPSAAERARANLRNRPRPIPRPLTDPSAPVERRNPLPARTNEPVRSPGGEPEEPIDEGELPPEEGEEPFEEGEEPLEDGEEPLERLDEGDEPAESDGDEPLDYE